MIIPGVQGKQGLGKCIVDLLDDKGVKVAVLDRTLTECPPPYHNVHFYQCDVSEYAGVKKVARQIREQVSRMRWPTFIYTTELQTAR